MRKAAFRNRWKATKVRSTMPPLKRKVTVGSPKNLVEFVGGPWDRMRGTVPSTFRNSEGFTIGKHKGRYEYNGMLKSYGRKGSGPAYMQFEWKPQPLFAIVAT